MTTTTLILTITHTKPIADIADRVANRIHSMEGTENVEVVEQPTQPSQALGVDDKTTQNAKRYLFLKNAMYFGSVDVGEAYLTMKVVGGCPSEEVFDAAIDAAINAKATS